MKKAKTVTPTPAGEPARVIFTISGYYTLEEITTAECIENLREAVEKLRECGSAECTASIPAHTEEL